MESAAQSKHLSPAIVALLGAAVLLNYVDRGNLATAAPLVQEELGLSGAGMGLLFSAFFWTYAPGQLLVGWAVHRYDVRHILGIGVAAWSLATAATGVASSLAALLAFRLLLGLGESVTFPSTQLLLARHAPEHRRGMLNGLIAVGQGIGPMAGTLFGGLVMAQVGWRPIFVALGVLTLAWILPWFWVTRGLPMHTPIEQRTASVGYAEILRRREFWGAAIGHFCANYGFYFVLTWLPSFLVKSAGFTVQQMAVTGAIIYGLYSLSTALCGHASDQWIGRGGSVTVVRKTFIAVSMAGAGGLTALCGFADAGTAVVLLCLCGVFYGVGTPMVFTIGTTLAGARAAGKWAGAQNVAGQVAGIVAPVATGFIYDATGEFTWALLSSAVVSVIGILAWVVGIRRIEPLQWSVPGGTRSSAAA